MDAEEQIIVDKLTELRNRAEAAENNELQAYRLLLPRLVNELNEAKAQNEDLQRVMRESATKPAPGAVEPETGEDTQP